MSEVLRQFRREEKPNGYEAGRYGKGSDLLFFLWFVDRELPSREEVRHYLEHFPRFPAGPLWGRIETPPRGQVIPRRGEWGSPCRARASLGGVHSNKSGGMKTFSRETSRKRCGRYVPMEQRPAFSWQWSTDSHPC